jgi:GNAT superfamily N-acetyltransferase
MPTGRHTVGAAPPCGAARCRAWNLEALVPRVPIEIRPAGPSDLDDVLRLWNLGRDEVAVLGRAVPGAELVARRLARGLESGVLQVQLARRDGEGVGFVLMHEAPMAGITETPVLSVDELYVVPAARRHGIARALLGHVAARAETIGAEQIISSVTPLARDTHRFFARLGFTPVAIRRSVTPSTLRRRLCGDPVRGPLEDLLSRRRSQRARGVLGSVLAERLNERFG